MRVSNICLRSSAKRQQPTRAQGRMKRGLTHETESVRADARSMEIFCVDLIISQGCDCKWAIFLLCRRLCTVLLTTERDGHLDIACTGCSASTHILGPEVYLHGRGVQIMRYYR